MSHDDPARKIKELEGKIRVLEVENELLTERGEDTLLLSLISEQINNLAEHDEIMDIALEQIAVLKGIFFCASAKVEGNSCLINRSFCSTGLDGFEGGRIELTGKVIEELTSGPVLIDYRDPEEKGATLLDSLADLDPRGLLLLPTFGRLFPDRIFIFANDISVDSLQNDRNLLQRTVEMIADRLDNIILLEQISTLNRDLDQKVEQRTAELKNSEALYRALVENIDLGVTLIDAEHNIVMANVAQGKMFGCPPEAFMGKKCFNEFEKRDSICEHCPGVKAMETGKVAEVITHGEKGNGEKFTVRIKAFPLVSEEGKASGFIEVVEDISERIQVEEDIQQARKLESMGILAGGIGHDFNNLLTAIMGNISLAKLYSSPADKVHAKLAEMEKATLRARDLTEQLLTFAKGGSPVKQTTSIKELVSEAATFTLRGSNVKCQFEFPDDLWLIDVDPGQLGQVIQNLVINASQAMASGGVIHLVADNYEHRSGDPYLLAPGRFLRISVRDEGEGIEPQFLDRIFDPYFTTKATGTGIGLATSYSIIKNHGGLLTVDSEPGVGSTFYIYLPVSTVGESDRPGEIKEALPGTAGELATGNGRVLIMDDEEIVLEVAGEMLEHAGYQAGMSSNGQEAVKMYSQAIDEGEPFAAVILDLTVPGQGWGGIETLQKLREIDPEVKAIVSSGYVNNPAMVDFRAHGFAARIAKPYRIERLSKTLHELLADDSG